LLVVGSGWRQGLEDGGPLRVMLRRVQPRAVGAGALVAEGACAGVLVCTA